MAWRRAVVAPSSTPSALIIMTVTPSRRPCRKSVTPERSRAWSRWLSCSSSDRSALFVLSRSFRFFSARSRFCCVWSSRDSLITVEPATIPMARARKTATRLTRWYRKLIIAAAGAWSPAEGRAQQEPQAAYPQLQGTVHERHRHQREEHGQHQSRGVGPAHHRPVQAAHAFGVDQDAAHLQAHEEGGRHAGPALVEELLE